MKYIKRSTIARLNQIGRANVRTGMRVPSALEAAAHTLGLRLVKRDGDTILYRNSQGAYVNCWLEGPMSQDIIDGGAGFDDNIEWAFITTDD